MCEIMIMPDGALRDRVPYVLNFEWTPSKGFSCSDDVLEINFGKNHPMPADFGSSDFGGTLNEHQKKEDCFNFRTATSFKCSCIWLKKLSNDDEPIQIQLKVGSKHCARLLFLNDERLSLVEELNPLQLFKFYFPCEVPSNPFKFKLIGQLMMPVP